MTAEQLDEIQKSLDAATPGPWEAKEKEVHTAKEDIEGYKTQVCKFTPSRIAASNIHLIAHAPTWLRSLLAEVQRQQGEIERLKNYPESVRLHFTEACNERDRLQAENDQLRQQVQHEHNLHMQEMDERRKARDEEDQLRQQLDEWKRLLLQADTKLKGDRTDG